MRPSRCPICKTAFVEGDPRWSWHAGVRQWRHNCILVAPIIGRPRVDPTPEIELQLASRKDDVVIVISTLVNQISLPPENALQIARGLIMHAARAGDWGDCRSDLPNLIRQMRQIQKEYHGDRTFDPAAPATLKVCEAAVDQWLERFDDEHRPALKTLAETAAEPAPGPPS